MKSHVEYLLLKLINNEEKFRNCCNKTFFLDQHNIIDGRINKNKRNKFCKERKKEIIGVSYK